MGDLQGEFSFAPDKGEELSLEEPGAALGSDYSGNLGKYTTGLVSRAIGGFNISSAKAHLSKVWGPGSSTRRCRAARCYHHEAFETAWF
jgi:fatty acid synthase subunit alpha, fungi type